MDDDVLEPNDETMEAIEEIEDGGGVSWESADNLFNSWDNEIN